VQFVFEEDLDLPKVLVEKIKRHQFESKVPKDVAQGREALLTKSKTYYSNEALNPRPKRGRPPKQVAKVEMEPQVSMDIYLQVPTACRAFLYIPDIVSAASVTFSAKFETEEHLLASLRGSPRVRVDEKLEALSQRLESLRHLSNRLSGAEKTFGIDGIKKPFLPFVKPKLKETKTIEILPESKELKIGAAIGSILPKKRGRPRKEEAKPEEFAVQKRRRFAIKKVTQIKTKKSK